MVGGDGAVPDDPPPDVLRRQAHRLDALGHRLWLAEATAERLGEPVTGS